MRSIVLAFASVLVMAGASAAQAATYSVEHCQVSVPDGWVTSKSRIARPDKKVWASLLEAPTAAEIVNVEASLKAVKLSEDARQIVMVSTASFGGLTNKQFHVITKTSPSCVADVTAPAGPDEALAKQIGQTVAMHK